jgi:hypothetical protein
MKQTSTPSLHMQLQNVTGKYSDFCNKDEGASNSLCELRAAQYKCAPISSGNTFQDLPQLRETVDNTKRYI